MKAIEIPKGERCKSHKKKRKVLRYLDWVSEAEKRTKKGQKQIQCPKCKYWFWPDTY
jgi:hypothetical protein